MTLRTNAFVNLVILTIAFKEVASWTIDLPEVRKFLFEKNEKYKKNEHDDYLNSDQKLYSNIEGNSKHNSKDYEHERSLYDKEDKYADEYGYHNYMEKKVHEIVNDGSTYLEGLQRSLEEYSMMLESCNRRNFSGSSNSSSQNTTSGNSTSWRPELDFPSNSSMPNFNSSYNNNGLTFQNYDNSTVPSKPGNSSDDRRNMRVRSRRRNMTCEEATEASEQVRRYSDLSLWATRRLQDLAYAKKYQKTDEQEENELILKLAWFLDRLAYLSGYEPNYKDYEYEPRGTRTTPTVEPIAQTLVPSSEELNQEMMDCLRRNSSEPATVRCRYPMQVPDLIANMFNSSGTTPSSRPSQDSSSVIPMNRPTDSFADQSSEILVTADNSAPNTFTSKSISKRSTEYTYYFPPKPLHEMTYPAPLVKLIRHRLHNIKSIVKAILEKRLAHIAEKKEEKDHFENHHFEKRSIDENSVKTSNFIAKLSISPNPIVKSLEKRPLDVGSPVGLIHYPVSDVSVINTKSFKKRSIDERRVTSNHVSRMSNLKSIVKSNEKGPLVGKKFQNVLAPRILTKRLSKYPVSDIKSVKKRYTDDPLSKLANYYIKYKVWDNSNPTKENFIKKGGIFEVKNHLNEPKTISKRSLLKKKVIHMHFPKQLQIVHTYVYGSKHNHHGIHKATLLSHLQKLNDLKHNLKHKKIEKAQHKIIKRSLHYEDIYLPRIPMDPQGDISYYIKNKEGTNYNPSLIQAAQVRLGLEQVQQTGNIEIIRRFGANYNPLNPAPLYTGILAGMADA